MENEHVERIRLGIVGCGAVTRQCHLPALVGNPWFRLTALVDVVEAHATQAMRIFEQLSAENHTESVRDQIVVRTDLDSILPMVDAVVVATPHATHADLTVRALRAGRPVFVEKPVALTVAECDQMVAAAAESGCEVMPGHLRRLFPSVQWIRSIVDSGVLGRIHRVRWAEGFPYQWPAVSGFMFDAPFDGGGLLLDIGPHVLDILRRWFGGPVRLVSIADNADATGSDSELSATLLFGDVPAEIELSRLRELSNQCVIEGTAGTVTVGVSLEAEFTQSDSSGKIVASGPVPVLAPAQAEWGNAFREQLAEFAHRIAGAEPRLATLEDGVSTVSMLAACQSAHRNRLARPWEGAPAGPPLTSRIAVTGASGFIGAHIVDRIIARHGRTTAVVRNLARLARLSHLDRGHLTFSCADTRDVDELAKAFTGCDVVVHTVYGNGVEEGENWSVSVDGTRAVLDAAKIAGVRRLIHVSSVAVYDTADQDAVNEETPLVARVLSDRGYAQQKLAAERLVLEVDPAELEVICVHPTIVYGPWGGVWTSGPLRRLAKENDFLPTGDHPGVCNAVHVHDVADAILFLAELPDPGSRHFLVSGPESVSWGEFYDAFRGILGIATPVTSDPAGLPAWEQDLYSEHAVASINRLAAAGFVPRMSFSAGIDQLGSWVQWVGPMGS